MQFVNYLKHFQHNYGILNLPGIGRIARETLPFIKGACRMRSVVIGSDVDPTFRLYPL